MLIIRLGVVLYYAVLWCGVMGGCLFVYLLGRLYLNTSPEYMAWLMGFVS